MNTSWYRRLVHLIAGPVAAAGVIGGAMGMSAIAHANGTVATPPGYPIVHLAQ
jgi:hypothetical protein